MKSTIRRIIGRPVELTGAWLERCEVPSEIESLRLFDLELGGERFQLGITHAGAEAPFAGSLGIEPRRPDDSEVLEIIQRAFLGSLPRPEIDFAAGWAAYRRALAETTVTQLPEWDELPGDVKEAFCVAMRTAAADCDAKPQSKQVIKVGGWTPEKARELNGQVPHSRIGEPEKPFAEFKAPPKAPLKVLLKGGPANGQLVELTDIFQRCYLYRRADTFEGYEYHRTPEGEILPGNIEAVIFRMAEDTGD